MPQLVNNKTLSNRKFIRGMARNMRERGCPGTVRAQQWR